MPLTVAVEGRDEAAAAAGAAAATGTGAPVTLVMASSAALREFTSRPWAAAPSSAGPTACGSHEMMCSSC